MRKQLTIVAVIGLSLGLMSWGFKGHRAVAAIAQKHLTANTARLVQAYLSGETLTGVSTWADENRDKTTASWHYLNLPLGLNHEQFADAVSKQGNDNVYSAILKVEAILKDKTSTPGQKKEALKYLVHLVGDAHQPMHVSRAADKGGNTIQLQFDGKGTNLHSLWDSKLIDHEGLSEADIAKQYDWANNAQIKKWQADSPMEWLWESYQISSELYDDIQPGQAVEEAYYKKYIKTIRLRIDQAGIRLAGELNKFFNDEQVKITSVQLLPPPNAHFWGAHYQKVGIKEVQKHLGDTVKVTDVVYGLKDIGSMTLINLGAAYPNQLLTVVLKDGAKEYLEVQEQQGSKPVVGKPLTAIGVVTMYKGKPQIVIADPDKFNVGRR